VLPNYQHTLKMGTELVSETSENLHILRRLSAREYFMEKHHVHSKHRTTHPTTELHKLDAQQPAMTASLTSKHDSHEKYINDSANIKDTEKYEFYC
jgi:hypothetical protein